MYTMFQICFYFHLHILTKFVFYDSVAKCEEIAYGAYAFTRNRILVFEYRSVLRKYKNQTENYFNTLLHILVIKRFGD